MDDEPIGADEQCVVTVWSHRSEASYCFVTTGPSELESFIESVNNSERHDISSINPLNPVKDFGTGLEMGGELW